MTKKHIKSKEKKEKTSENGNSDKQQKKTTEGKAESIEGHPPDMIRTDLQNTNQGHTVRLELDETPEYSLFGDDIPQMDSKFLHHVAESRMKLILEKGHAINGESNAFWSHSFKVVEKLNVGRNVYTVSDAAHKEDVYFMKAMVADPVKRDSNIAHDILLLQNSCKTRSEFRKHFLQLVNFGKLEDKYNFVVTRLGGQNLVDIRATLKANGEFSKADAVRLSMQTLQAVHDVHLCCFIHRDLQPKNFVVGITEKDRNVIYVVNFGFAFEYYPNKCRRSLLAKHASLSRKFQPRTFHTASVYKRLDDMESWLYLCLWFFNSKCLPWEYLLDSDERQICNRKELFFHGYFDKRLSMTPNCFVPKFLFAVRDKIHNDILLSSCSPINYPFFAEAILSAEPEITIDWKAPFEWQQKGDKKRSD